MSERCERTVERTSEWPSTYIPILRCSKPPWTATSIPRFNSPAGLLVRIVVKVVEIVFPVSRMKLGLNNGVSKIEIMRRVVVENKAGIGLCKVESSSVEMLCSRQGGSVDSH